MGVDILTIVNVNTAESVDARQKPPRQMPPRHKPPLHKLTDKSPPNMRQKPPQINRVTVIITT